MGQLTAFLQQEFARHCPAGWRCLPERSLLAPSLAELLGYQAKADVLLEKDDGSRRLWVEFEVSRADPVANHAKFATTHLFAPQPPTDCFVAMVSPHVTRGRRNLAASTVGVMRSLGMRAFQTTLLPHLAAAEVKRLNHLGGEQLAAAGLPVGAELERAFVVTEPMATVLQRDLHLVGDPLDVLFNLRQWNQDLGTAEGRRLWGQRRVTYFVHEPGTDLFAPAKFCGYSVLPSGGRAVAGVVSPALFGRMTMAVYAALNTGTHLLDGHRAQAHLSGRLGMIKRRVEEAADLGIRFARWHATLRDAVRVHGEGPVALLPPPWFM